MQFNRTYVLLIGGVLVFVLTTLVLFGNSDKTKTMQSTSMDSGPTAIIDGYALALEIVNTPEEQSKGLGGRTNLPDDYGMLFPFENQLITPVFWMKGMEIPIDILWISGKTIIDIDKNVPPEPGVPDHELKRYSPEKPVDYVIEVRGGLSDEKGFDEGDAVTIHPSDSINR